jgi:signal peptidase II
VRAGTSWDRLFRSPGRGRGAGRPTARARLVPSFNVADSGIVVGGMLAVLLSFRGIELDGRTRGRDSLPHDGR